MSSDTPLDDAWKAAEAALPEGWGFGVQADGPGYVARAIGPDHGPLLEVEAWSQGDIPGLPDYDARPTPAAALLALAEKLTRA